ncbi:MAG TPA: amidase [Kofleriaceae bacterium]|nr:amidase [Kofleriaceae bacterium]
MQLASLDATATAALVRDGRASPREIVDAAIARIEQHNAALGPVIVPMYDAARRAADAMADHGQPFRGVPILIKDLVATIAGVPQASGVRPLREARLAPKETSHLVASLERAGFIVVGKSNTPELGILPSTEPPAWPPTRNPYDPSRTPGGSSGGSACAVAAGLVPIGHANDGGGSIRIPASCCGLFGLKPSRGRISFAPNFGDINGGLVNEHVVTRSVRDSAAVLDLLAGVQRGDPYTAPPGPASYLALVGDPPPRLRIGFETRRMMPDGEIREVHPDCVAAVDHAAQLLRAAGHTVELAELPGLRDPEWVARFLTIWAVGVTVQLDAASRELGRAIRPDEIEVLTYTLAELGRTMSGSAYAEAWAWIHRASRRLSAFWDTYDLWLTPTVTEPPPPLGTFQSPADDPLGGIMRAAEFAPFTAPFNATGQPACSLPLFHNAAGLPIGVQLVAAYGREDLLVRVAAQLEAAQPFAHKATRA